MNKPPKIYLTPLWERVVIAFIVIEQLFWQIIMLALIFAEIALGELDSPTEAIAVGIIGTVFWLILGFFLYKVGWGYYMALDTEKGIFVIEEPSFLQKYSCEIAIEKINGFKVTDDPDHAGYTFDVEIISDDGNYNESFPCAAYTTRIAFESVPSRRNRVTVFAHECNGVIKQIKAEKPNTVN